MGTEFLSYNGENGEHSVRELSLRLKENVRKVIMGKDDIIEKTILCFLTGGHLLLEDIPGTGKTTLAKALARSVGCTCKRVQFTPDLLPSDLTGVNFYNQKEQEFFFKKGSVFTNILIGDEINRATPRTQSSLLECMEEGQVSVDGVTYELALPFFVIATQNPIETQGTFPLPEAQLDRFLMRISMGYPSFEDEVGMLEGHMKKSPLSALEVVATGDEVIRAQKTAREVKAGKAVFTYILDIVTATRESDQLRLGVSPRGALSLLHTAQTFASMNGRDYIKPDDVKKVCKDVLCHRVLVKGSRLSQNGVGEQVIDKILEDVPVPSEEAPEGAEDSHE